MIGQISRALLGHCLGPGDWPIDLVQRIEQEAANFVIRFLDDIDIDINSVYCGRQRTHCGVSSSSSSSSQFHGVASANGGTLEGAVSLSGTPGDGLKSNGT